jgi:hypothetical protein
MLSIANLGILGIPHPGLIYIVADNIWLTQTSGTPGLMRRVGSLSSCIRALIQNAPRNGVLANVPDHVSWVDELRFCLCYLIPYLKFLDKGKQAEMKCSPDIEQAVSNITQKATLLPGCLRYTTGQTIPLELLQKIFCVPCMVGSQQVIPLEPAGAPVCSAPNGITVRYQLYPDRTRPLSRVITEIQQEIEKRNQESSTDDVHRETAALMQEVDRLIARFEPVNLGRFQVIYYDRYHQVHYSRGHFVLVRGPVHRRKADQGGPIYVGLTISGAKRENWLMRRPRPCNKPEELWTAAGVPMPDGMCMGDLSQYKRLQSSNFTDAEAVVQWLDAGVILATGLSLFHKEQRNLKLKEIQQVNVRLERRRLENERRKSMLALDRLYSNGTMLPDGRHLRRGIR